MSESVVFGFYMNRLLYYFVMFKVLFHTSSIRGSDGKQFVSESNLYRSAQNLKMYFIPLKLTDL